MNFSADLNIGKFQKRLNGIKKEAQENATTGTNDAVDEILRIASEIAPFQYGTLQRSHKRKVNEKRGGLFAEIAFSVSEGGFNYARWIHEGVYELGSESVSKGGTTSNLSGKSYAVGRKYLSRPIEGESEAVRQHIAKLVSKALR
ncbi:hypothetical protein CHL76_02200 [Marinococcus halophilus]|uniref:HK97 gp10 family phage protein n=1 Tax=Marinococcus halophilus TaxID=1371 RepID=A0A510Y2P8_MARHA|nr:hypothetical protein [Marinococcus halophilus]OZT81188.1 hypothetical protein CHL76_02200 [Marinococcus halophilus]GEK57121.1 hypothetical protein MHA01_00260 [Marinococcus halophilus]